MTAPPLRCLIIENEPHWQVVLKRAVEQIGGEVDAHIGDDPEAARSLISRNRYDLATIDLSLLEGNPPDDREGLLLAERFFHDERHRGTALLVVTGHATNESTRKLLRDRKLRVFDVVEKKDFDLTTFLSLARAALLDARCRRAQEQIDAQYRLLLTFSSDRWMGAELFGPDRRGTYQAEIPLPLALEDLSGRADRLNALLGSPALWREDARSVGEAMYEALLRDQQIANQIASAFALSEPPENPLLIQFIGPSAGLALPFELMRDNLDYLCYQHLITRKVQLPVSRRIRRFHAFLHELRTRNEPLRILLVGANADGRIPKVEEEVRALEVQTRTEASRLGFGDLQIEVLDGVKAQYSLVVEALRTGGFHMLHYAGHGRFNSTLPEAGGLVFAQRDKLQTLTAAAFHTLAEQSPLQFVYLSSCVGAQTARQPGRGDFQGTLEALAMADVPVVLGHRWAVSDNGAMEMAQTFYRSLWRTLSPSRALLEARRALSIEHGRDESTWASPVLLCQTD